VAVVSISRIQIRRGRRTELPQLASGELGWSIDTQELYIGNGAVAEGAPYVGNTKLLTQHDNLFQFADSYTYKSVDGFVQTGDTINNPVIRTLQDRLDDIVSIRSFGASGDGTDQTEDLQRALDQLYLNPANNGTEQSRVILVLEPGVYRINNSLKVPPHATIRGAGIDKTFIQAGTNDVFLTVNSNSSPGAYAADSTSSFNTQARNIEISGLTITTDGADGIVLESCRDSIFRDLKISSNTDFSAQDINAGIRLKGLSTLVNSNNNLFSNIKISDFSEGIYSDYDISKNTWENCSFTSIGTGIAFGMNTVIGTLGQATGPVSNTIKNCKFDSIFYEGIHIKNGSYNTSENNRFYNVGNYGGDYGSAFKTANIKFNYEIDPAVGTNSSESNQSFNDYFQRTLESGSNPEFIINYPYVPEISGYNFATLGYTYKLGIGELQEFSKLFNLPADVTRSYIIDYTATSKTIDSSRTGTIEVIVDPVDEDVQITDDYVYRGIDDENSRKLRFTAEIFDENNDGTIDTVALMVYNSISNDDTEFTYTIKSKS
jgi:parallel beta-helix repeat protein